MTQLAENTKADDSDGDATPSLPPPSLGYKLMHGLGWTFVWLGALTLGFVAHQLWITTFFAKANQADLEVELEERFAAAEIVEVEYKPVVVAGEDPPPEPDPTIAGGASGTPGLLKTESPPESGSAFAEIRIPSLESLEDGWTVVEGVKLSQLKNGAGHMPWTPLPGQPGNAVISGHRTTYGQPFHDLDQLVSGDLIEVDTALGTHVYSVTEVFVVKPTDVWVTHPKSGAWLTLTTCNPKFSARERLIVHAQLVAGPNADVILGRV
ncbi:MAG: class E sortase [Acidimicrobiia bacterium]|nr:class E sortase [Acidimicrobiia bacterium]